MIPTFNIKRGWAIYVLIHPRQLSKITPDYYPTKKAAIAAAKGAPNVRT